MFILIHTAPIPFVIHDPDHIPVVFFGPYHLNKTCWTLVGFRLTFHFCWSKIHQFLSEWLSVRLRRLAAYETNFTTHHNTFWTNLKISRANTEGHHANKCKCEKTQNLPAISCYDKYKHNKNKTKQIWNIVGSGCQIRNELLKPICKPTKMTIASFRQRNNTFTNHHLRLAATLHPYH